MNKEYEYDYCPFCKEEQWLHRVHVKQEQIIEWFVCMECDRVVES